MVKMYNADIVLSIAGSNYYIDDVSEITIEKSGKNQITRGNNVSNSVGLTYRTDMNIPDTWTVTSVGISLALKKVLESAWYSATRFNIHVIDRTTGESATGGDCVLSNQPRQLNFSGDVETLNVVLEIQTFKTELNLKG